MYEFDKGEEMNPMEQVSNNGEKISRLFFIFYTCGVILRYEEYCSDKIPKCLTRKKCVVIWKPEHNCVVIDLVCFNLFMFLSPRVRYSRVLQTRVFPVL
jgi:hypothetical protein